jgi:type II secretory pathway component PulM
MSADTLSPRGISSFGLVGQVSPSDQLITLTFGQLEALISEAVARAQDPLLERLETTEAQLQAVQARLAALEEGVRCREGEEPWPQPQAVQEHAHKESTRNQPGAQGSPLLQSRIVFLEGENRGLKEALSNLEELRPWIEALSKKLARLEAPTPSRKTEARAEKIAKYLKERPDHRAAYETLRGHLGIDKRRLLEAIKLLMATDPGRYGIACLLGDKRGRTLIMLPK